MSRVHCNLCGASTDGIADMVKHHHDDPRPFLLVRDQDVTGVSGTGVVAQGVEFTDGVVALRWLSQWPTSVVFHDDGLRSVQQVHGHGGRTRIVWIGVGTDA